MGNTKYIGAGLIVIIISGIASMIAVASAPDLDKTNECDLLEDDSMEWLDQGCKEVQDDDSSAMIWFFVMCCIPMPIGIVLVVQGFRMEDPGAKVQIVVQQAPHLLPAQPTYAPPVPQQQVQQPQSQSQSRVELELKKGRMRTIETLRVEGRLMEAALEAEMAGEVALASELRTQAERNIRELNQPKSNEEDTYLAYLSSAMADSFLSIEEETLLEQQRGILGISWDTHVRMLADMGHTHERLKQFQQAKIMEDSGRFLESAAIYESLGSLDKAQMLRMKAQMMESRASGNITYNINDSVVQGDLDGGN
jgi:hypothetical protein